MAGKLFEDLLVGQVFQHQPGRTVTEADNVFFSCLTMNPQPLHVDFHAAAKAEFGKPLVNSLFTLGVAVGLSVGDTTLGTTVGNLGFVTSTSIAGPPGRPARRRPGTMSSTTARGWATSSRRTSRCARTTAPPS